MSSVPEITDSHTKTTPSESLAAKDALKLSEATSAASLQSELSSINSKGGNAAFFKALSADFSKDTAANGLPGLQLSYESAREGNHTEGSPSVEFGSKLAVEGNIYGQNLYASSSQTESTSLGKYGTDTQLLPGEFTIGPHTPSTPAMPESASGAGGGWSSTPQEWTRNGK